MYPLESLTFNLFLVSKDKETGGLWVARNFSKPERQTDRQTDRETNRETDKQIKNQSVKGVHHKGSLLTCY